MELARHLDDNCLIVHPIGELPLTNARAIALDAIAEARAYELQRLLLDFTDATISPLPTLAERFEIVREWADAAPEPFTLAIAAREEMLDPDRIGQIMATRLGLQTHVFEDSVDALMWVKRQRVPRSLLLENPMYH
ncbi:MULTISPECIES: hypothetical protein [unclassified Lysobacter]